MTGATLFSGIGAPEQAAPWIDWKWSAENDPFASRVLAYRHPQTTNLGDVTDETFIAKAKRFGSVDVIVAGAPCQDFSVAGERAGMDGARGNLSLRFIEIVAGLRPLWLLFENVPGLFSSASHKAPYQSDGTGLRPLAKGSKERYQYEADEESDFGYFLSALSELGYGLAWTVLDAQFFALAQRRERVFVVGYLGDWHAAFAVLSDLKSLQRNPPPSREARQDVAGTLGGGTGERGWCPDTDRMTFVPATAYALNAKGGSGRIDGESDTFVAAPLNARPCADNASHESRLIAHTLRAGGFDASEDGTGREIPLVADTLRSHPQPGSNSVGTIAFQSKQSSTSQGPSFDHLSSTLDVAKADGIAVAIPILEAGARTGKSTTDERAGIGIGADGDPMFTLQSGKQHAVALESQVRRLSVVECARLQGLPDTYAHIPGKRRKITAETAEYLKSHSLNVWQDGNRWYTDTPADGPMYKCLGNSMAVPVIAWILTKINLVNAIITEQIKKENNEHHRQPKQRKPRVR